MFETLLNLVRHTKDTVDGWSGETWFAWALFAILFAETGLVVLPFLPGDSLLFVVGAIVAGGKSHVGLAQLLVIMSAAAVLGDTVNYAVGKRVGPAVFASESSRWFNKEHLLKAQAFYEKYGGKTIVLARFVPIVRTFAPFVAGIGTMAYMRFAAYNVLGGMAWVAVCLGGGYAFGNITFVKNNFSVVILAIVAVSMLPLLVEYLRHRRR
jgi:membrane-associated protein